MKMKLTTEESNSSLLVVVTNKKRRGEMILMLSSIILKTHQLIIFNYSRMHDPDIYLPYPPHP